MTRSLSRTPGQPMIGRQQAHDPEQPYLRLIAAFLQRVVWDAQDRQHGAVAYSPDFRRAMQREAQAFLRDTRAVAFWVELTGASVEAVLPTLWAQAGLTDTRRGASQDTPPRSREDAGEVKAP